MSGRGTAAHATTTSPTPPPAAAPEADVPAVEPAMAAVATGGEEQGDPPPAGLHHLTRHWLPEDERGEAAVLQRLGAPDVRTAETMIR